MEDDWCSDQTYACISQNDFWDVFFPFASYTATSKLNLLLSAWILCYNIIRLFFEWEYCLELTPIPLEKGTHTKKDTRKLLHLKTSKVILIMDKYQKGKKRNKKREVLPGYSMQVSGHMMPTYLLCTGRTVTWQCWTLCRLKSTCVEENWISAPSGLGYAFSHSQLTQHNPVGHSICVD